MDKVLVTGATGLVGRHVIRKLLSRGYRVYGLIRETSDDSILGGLGVHPVRGDLRRPETLIRATAGMDGVIHAAAKVGDWGARRQFYQLNVEGAEALLQGALRHGVARFVHVSSVAVSGRTEKRTIYEEEPAHPAGHPYVDTKILAEQKVRQFGNRGLGISIVRPATIYGEGDRNFLPRLRMLIERRMPLVVGSGEQLANLVYVENVADLLLLLLEKERARGEAFHCLDRDLITWNELIRFASALLGVRGPTVRIPQFLAYNLGLLLEVLSKAVRRADPPPITRFGVKLMGGQFFYDTSKAERLLGYRPRFTTKQGLCRSIACPQADQGKHRG